MPGLDVGAARREQVARQQRDHRPRRPVPLRSARAALLLGREQLLQRRARRGGATGSAKSVAPDLRELGVHRRGGRAPGACSRTVKAERQRSPGPRRRPPTRARSGSPGCGGLRAPASAATARRPAAPRWLRICRYSVCWTSASCSWPRSMTWYLPANPSARQRYCSSIRSMYFAGVAARPARASRRTSRRPRPRDAAPPAAGAAPTRSATPHGVDSTASSSAGAQRRSAPPCTVSFGDAGGARAVLEAADLVEGVAPEPGDVHR